MSFKEEHLINQTKNTEKLYSPYQFFFTKCFFYMFFVFFQGPDPKCKKINYTTQLVVKNSLKNILWGKNILFFFVFLNLFFHLRVRMVNRRCSFQSSPLISTRLKAFQFFGEKKTIIVHSSG